MIIINIKTIYLISLLVIIIISLLIYLIYKIYRKHVTHNCFNCQYYYLTDITETGDACYYTCKKTNRIDSHRFNINVHYEKCKEYKQKESVKSE